MTVRRLEWSQLLDLLASPLGLHDLGGANGELIVVRPAEGSTDARTAASLRSAVAALPVVVAVAAAPDHPAAAVTSPEAGVADVVVDGDDLELVVERFGRAPIAATALAVLLRGSESRPVGEGLAAESAVYSTLQAGPEFAAWRADRPVQTRPPKEGPSVRVERDGSELLVTLDRPDVRNALDVRMRDELWSALLVAVADPDLTIRWRGAGPAFCAGGDLDEFGSRPDPAHGHLTRLARSLGRLLAELADRTTVELHGACAGSGIELPAFARHVRAGPDTAISLPELALGLVPGAGGTVSLPRRIGRHRTAWLVLTGRTIDAATALDWGLVDALDPGPPGDDQISPRRSAGA